MAQEYLEIVFRLVAALAAGGLIGLERSHRGRPAGFRTHALVCLASSLLMLVTVYESTGSRAIRPRAWCSIRRAWRRAS